MASNLFRKTIQNILLELDVLKNKRKVKNNDWEIEK